MDCPHLVEILEFRHLMEHQDQHLEDGLLVVAAAENGILLLVQVELEVLVVEEQEEQLVRELLEP